MSDTIELLGLIVETGRKTIGTAQRNVKLALYHDSTEVGRLDIVAKDPSIGDQYDIAITRRER